MASPSMFWSRIDPYGGVRRMSTRWTPASPPILMFDEGVEGSFEPVDQGQTQTETGSYAPENEVFPSQSTNVSDRIRQQLGWRYSQREEYEIDSLVAELQFYSDSFWYPQFQMHFDGMSTREIAQVADYTARKFFSEIGELPTDRGDLIALGPPDPLTAPSPFGDNLFLSQSLFYMALAMAYFDVDFLTSTTQQLDYTKSARNWQTGQPFAQSADGTWASKTVFEYEGDVYTSDGFLWSKVPDQTAALYRIEFGPDGPRDPDFPDAPQSVAGSPEWRLPEITSEGLFEQMRKKNDARLQDLNLGGGGGRNIAFDEEMLKRTGRKMWRAYLREEPNNEKVAAAVSRYVQQATKFYLEDGGSLDFETFAVNNILKTEPRWGLLYAKKPYGVDELEWAAKYDQTAHGVGIRESQALDRASAAMRAGQSTEGFAKQVTGEEGFLARNVGAFSQGFANTMRRSILREPTDG